MATIVRIRNTVKTRALPFEGPWALPVAAAIGAFLIRFSAGPLTVDDAYITFRYARNLAEGLGFVYNAGDHVIGTTTPLWTLILACLYRFGLHDLPSVSFILGSVLDGVTTLLVFRLALDVGLNRPWASAAASLYALCPLSIAATVQGMETPLFTALIVGAIVGDVEDRPLWAGTCAGLAAVVRPEGLILLCLLALRQIVGRSRVPLRAAALAVVPGMAWFTFAWLYTGHVVPQSIAAKSVVYPPSAIGTLRLLLTCVGLPGFSSQWVYVTPHVRTIALACGVALMVAAAHQARHGWRCSRADVRLISVVGFVPALLFFYVVSGALIFSWYPAPTAPFIAVGLACFARRRSRVLAPLCLLAALGWMAAGLNLGRAHGLPALAPSGMSTAREQGLIALGTHLRSQIGVHDQVALPEIGAFGYESNTVVFDTIGLVSPPAVKYYPGPEDCTGYCVPPAMVEHERPSYLIAISDYLQQPLTRAVWFRRAYRLISSVPVGQIGPDRRVIMVFHRAS